MEASLDQILWESLDQNGEQIAIDGGKDDSRTYNALSREIAAIQRMLSDFETPSNIGILSNHACETYAAVLAVLLSGRTFVPLNPKFPLDRLQAICDQAGCQTVLFDENARDLAEQLRGSSLGISGLNLTGGALIPGRPIAADHIAYRMFTSGSTGMPKGVPIRFESLDHYVRALTRLLKLEPGLRFSQTFDLSFDLSVHDIFLALSSGGIIVPPRGLDLMMPHSYILKKKLDYWFSVPMLAGPILQAKLPHGETPLKAAMFCGEPLPTSYARGVAKLVASGGPVLNLYGPTEATIAFTERNLRLYDGDDEIMPIGRPFGDNRIAALVDGSVKDFTEGVEGELLLSGIQVFDGYDPHIETNVFVTAKAGQTYYRSGDLVRASGGELHHLGRIDTQVKIRGYRIELGEIEEAFRTTFDRQIAAATVIGSDQNAYIGIAYCGAAIAYDASALATKLPDYMVPRAAHNLSEMPTNVNGKIDRKALKDLSWG